MHSLRMENFLRDFSNIPNEIQKLLNPEQRNFPQSDFTQIRKLRVNPVKPLNCQLFRQKHLKLYQKTRRRDLPSIQRPFVLPFERSHFKN